MSETSRWVNRDEIAAYLAKGWVFKRPMQFAGDKPAMRWPYTTEAVYPDPKPTETVTFNPLAHEQMK